VALTVGIVRNESELVYCLFTMVCIHLVLCLRSSLVDKIRPQRVVVSQLSRDYSKLSSRAMYESTYITSPCGIVASVFTVLLDRFLPLRLQQEVRLSWEQSSLRSPTRMLLHDPLYQRSSGWIIMR
jgi:hypothetical protein